jgi:competence protein ComEC
MSGADYCLAAKEGRTVDVFRRPQPRVVLTGFFLGLISPLMLEQLPSLLVTGVLALLILLILLVGPSGRLLAAGLSGLVWALLAHHLVLHERLPIELDQQVLSIEGRVAGLPEATATGWRFQLQDALIVDTGESLPFMRVHWYAGEPVLQGEYWRFEARVRRPRGMSNPGAFDYEAWLYAQGIGALASIRSGQRLDGLRHGGVDGTRTFVRDRILHALGPTSSTERLLALIVGDRSVLSRDDWLILQATGTSHLMVISGLHVGLFAAGIFALVTLAGRLGLLHLSFPRIWMAAPLAILAAAIYAALAGFAVPTQRALLMVSMVLLARLFYRQPGPWLFWLLALCLVVMADPSAPLLAGFWLSFMAVGLLIFGMAGRLRQSGLWWRWGRAQWVIFIGLWPWLLLWGMPGSLIAPWVNILAIPFVSLLVVPSALLGTLLELTLGVPWLLWFAAEALDGLFLALQWASGWHVPTYLAFPGWINWVLGVTGVLALLSPLSRLLWVPALACLPVLLAEPQPRPEEGEFWVTVLDVGQGLSVLVQTRQHALLYDAGARFSSGFDLGEAVVHPALTNLGVTGLDTLLVSQADNDHAGGAPAIVRLLSVDRVVAGQIEDQSPQLDAAACRPGESWSWNAVDFEIVYSAPAPAPANERSCVLRVTTGSSGVLLTGDVGIRGEYQMLAHDLSAELLLAPHHGSRTSSSYALIRAVEPRWVVFSAGHSNRFNHPHPNVVARYRELAVEPVYTSRAGAVRFVFDKQHGGHRDWNWRDSARRFWHE